MSTAVENVQRFFPEVTLVQDATKPIRIEVTKQDARSRAVRNHKACAMAVACKRSLALDGVVVSRRIAYLIKGQTAIRYSIPPSISREITSFDRGATFEPGVYSLGKPYHRLGQQGGNRPHTNAGTPKVMRHVTTKIRSILSDV